ncbi:hypothetical protein AX14_005547 [Amanita brunnescens Koide BX004]|nr:hypothetical protein AX14_005547 [Amanita brunnescens Koide BX004]
MSKVQKCVVLFEGVPKEGLASSQVAMHSVRASQGYPGTRESLGCQHHARHHAPGAIHGPRRHRHRTF